MLVNNENKWNGKIRIVGLSMDDEMETAKSKVNEKKWDKIEHY